MRYIYALLKKKYKLNKINLLSKLATKNSVTKLIGRERIGSIGEGWGGWGRRFN